jgi:hypothetical protein
MGCADNIRTLPGTYTAGDTKDPMKVSWGEALTVLDTSEIIVDRPDPHASITVAGVLIDEATGTFSYSWSAGDLVAGEGQLVKARLYRGGTGRKSTDAFRIDVQEDIT